MLRNPWHNPQEAPPDNSNPQPVERRTLTIKETAASLGINDWMVDENGQTGRHQDHPRRQTHPRPRQRPGPICSRKSITKRPVKMSARKPSSHGDQPYGANTGISTPKKIKRMTSTNELLWIRGTMELKLSRRWGKERGMFRDNHFDNGYAAHRFFTEKFGDSTLKPYRLSTSASSRPIPPPPGRAKDPSLSRQFQQPVRIGHYLSQQCRPRFAVRPVDRRLAPWCWNPGTSRTPGLRPIPRRWCSPRPPGPATV